MNNYFRVEAYEVGYYQDDVFYHVADSRGFDDGAPWCHHMAYVVRWHEKGGFGAWETRVTYAGARRVAQHFGLH